MGGVRRALVLAACVLLAACSGSPSGQHTSSPSASTPPPGGLAPTSALGFQQTLVNVVKRVRPSVVQIQTTSGLGSGIVFDRSGDIVTNAHVVGEATTMQVTTADGRTSSASTVGIFAPDDLALVRLQNAASAQLPAATFADSSKLAVGDIAIAIGNPLGLSSSVTDGIISAVGRTVSEGNGVVIPDAIQTSAAINPGNSGGALVDLSGDVIGIPTLAATDPELGGAANGIGFAIPSSTVRDIAQQLATTGKVTSSHRALLGVTLSTVTDFLGDPLGALVTSVTPGGPADKAGVQQGDVITAINGTAVTTVEALQEAVAPLQPGDKATLTVRRADGNHSITVTLGEQTG